MGAAEMALFVIDAVAGPQINTIKLWQIAENMKLPRAIFINQINREHANYEEAMSNLSSQFGLRVGAVSVPIGVDRDFRGVTDIVYMQASYFEGGKDRIESVPSDHAAAVEAARDTLIDLVAEADDDLMMKYLEGETLTQQELETLLRAAVVSGVLFPVFVGSALIEQGVSILMDAIVNYFPLPLNHQPIAASNGETVTIGTASEPSCYVFKSLSDPFVGRLSFVKVLNGTLEPGIELINARTGKKDRLTQLLEVCGKDNETVKQSVAGDIIVLPKLSDAKTGDTLSLGGKIEIAPLPFPKPLYPVAIEAANQKDEDKLGSFLSNYAETDPCVTLHRDEQTHQTILTTLGEGSVDLILSRLMERSNVEAKLLEVKVPYRETIHRTAEAQGRHKKQTGGAGQFGDCWVRLEPNTNGGYEFIDEVVGGRIPKGLIPAVDKGIREAMVEGFLTDDPFVDVKAAVYDGSYPSVDSNEKAFKLAGRLAFRAACEKADVYLLEPMANVEVTVTEEYAGTIMGDFSTRRGRVAGMSTDDNGRTVIRARVPYKEVITYARDLRSMTRGIGSYTLELEGYDEVPGDVSRKLVAEYQARRES
jgi:elongation factor G